MKRILAMMMAVLLIISLVGCGEENPLSDNADPGQMDREYMADSDNKDDQENSGMLDQVEDVLDEIIEDEVSEDFIWTFEDGTFADGTLTIKGTGEMSGLETDIPWGKYSDGINNVILSYGITSIGAGDFAFCNNLSSITIPDSVTSIGGRFVSNGRRGRFLSSNLS